MSAKRSRFLFQSPVFLGREKGEPLLKFKWPLLGRRRKKKETTWGLQKDYKCYRGWWKPCRNLGNCYFFFLFCLMRLAPRIFKLLLFSPCRTENNNPVVIVIVNRKDWRKKTAPCGVAAPPRIVFEYDLLWSSTRWLSRRKFTLRLVRFYDGWNFSFF